MQHDNPRFHIADRVGIEDMGRGHVKATTAINGHLFFGFGADEREALLGLVGQLREALEMGLDVSDVSHKAGSGEDAR